MQNCKLSFIKSAKVNQF